MPSFVTDVRFDRSSGSIVCERRNYEIRDGAMVAVGEVTEDSIPLALAGVQFRIYSEYIHGVGTYESDIRDSGNYLVVKVKNTGLVAIQECKLELISIDEGGKSVLPFYLESRGVFPQLPGQTATWYYPGDPYSVLNDAKIIGATRTLQQYLAAQPREGLSLVLNSPDGEIGRMDGKDVIYWFEAYAGGSCEDQVDHKDENEDDGE